MISLSSLPLEKTIKNDKTDDVLISMDLQLRYYLWQISKMNVKYSNTSLNGNRTQSPRISHYKKRWRDRYIKPDYKPLNFQDPLKMMNNLVNDSRTYVHVLSFQRILTLIIEDQNPNYVQKIVDNNGENILQSINF